MWAMPVRRFKRMHARIAIHRAQAQLDLLQVIVAPNLENNDYQRLVLALERKIDPMAGKRVLRAEDFKNGR